jgi:hypothetical protein
MKVSELIDKLQQQDPNAEVHFAYNSGDYWNTQVAATVDEVQLARVTHSAYHDMDKVMELDDCDEEDGDTVIEAREVVLLG